MGSESIAHEAEGRMGFSKIQLVGQKYRDKTTLAGTVFVVPRERKLLHFL